MEITYLLLALPYFLLLIGLEFWISRRQEKTVYHLPDLISNLSCGLSQQMLMVFLRLPLFGVYVFVYEELRLLTVAPSGVLFWIVGFVALDFVYYWWHRLSHEVSALWVGHVVHHQSERFNLSVGLRQDVLTNLTAFPFELIMAVAGLPPGAFLAMQAVATIYQFWIHTQLVKDLGPLEWFMMTPSHHRVHHGINPQYIDKNYGATFIIWDRVFGTFVKEEEAPVYGITTPLRSFHPIWAQLQYFDVILQKIKASTNLRERFASLVRSPAWWPASTPLYPPRIERENHEEGGESDEVMLYPRGLSKHGYWLVSVSFVPAALVILSMLIFRPSLSLWQQLLMACVSALLLALSGAFIEGLRPNTLRSVIGIPHKQQSTRAEPLAVLSKVG